MRLPLKLVLAAAMLCGTSCGKGGTDNRPVDPQPLACGELALEALPIVSGVEVAGAIAGSALVLPQTEGCVGSGAEAVYYVQTEEIVDLVWEVTPDFDGVAYIRSDCASGPELSCADFEGDLGFERAVYLRADPGTYFLFVDGFEADDAGPFRAMLRLREILGEGEECDPEGVLSRCLAGFGCHPETNTCSRETTCEDLTDDDGDELIDCEDDTDCKTLPVCAPGDGAVGTACTANSDCNANDNDPLCWTEVANGYPSGYCSEFCNLTNDDCGEGATCVNVRLPSGNGLCFKDCASDEECFDGYECRAQGTSRLCLPACKQDAHCPAAGFCNEDLGQCTEDTEDCSDGTDGDGDARVDCEDMDCSADATCADGHTSACSAAVAVTAGTDGDSSDGSQLFAGSCIGSGLAREDLYTYTPGSADEVGFLLVTLASDTDQGVYVRTTCSDATTEIGCADRAPGGTNEVLSIPAAGGVPVTIVVDGFESPAQAGPYSLSLDYVLATEEEDNNAFGTANAFAAPYIAQIAPPTDEDWVSVSVPGPSSTLAAKVVGLNGDCAARTIDSEVEIFDVDGGSSLAFDDDISQTNLCSSATATGLAEGTYFVRVSSSKEFAPFGEFPYQLDITVTP